jgi:serine/threonine-protein kinase
MEKPTIPGYDLLEPIGRGGMATVWRARQWSLDRIVALKVMEVDAWEQPGDWQRFRAEAEIAAKWNHPGLCQIYDAGETDGITFYAMEYVAGVSLGVRLTNEGPMSEAQALTVADHVARILGAVWTKYQAIHCDIKPDNILLESGGEVRITDFGLARVSGHATMNPDANYIVGTPNYLSPEQAWGDDHLDCRTDIYALGMTLYHAVTGIIPFGDFTDEDALEKQMAGYVADPSVWVPDLSPAFCFLLEKCLMKDREARYRDWTELRKDIEEVKAGRLPRGKLPEEGASTLQRTSEREQKTVRLMEAMKPKMAQPKAASRGPANRGPAARRPGQRPATITPKVAAPPPLRNSKLGPTFAKMLYLAALVGLSYWAAWKFV